MGGMSTSMTENVDTRHGISRSFDSRDTRNAETCALMTKHHRPLFSFTFTTINKPNKSKHTHAHPRIAINLLIEARVLVALANVEGFAGRRALAGDAASDRNAPPGGVLKVSVRVCMFVFSRGQIVSIDADEE